MARDEIGFDFLMIPYIAYIGIGYNFLMLPYIAYIGIGFDFWCFRIWIQWDRLRFSDAPVYSIHWMEDVITTLLYPPPKMTPNSSQTNRHTKLKRTQCHEIFYERGFVERLFFDDAVGR